MPLCDLRCRVETCDHVFESYVPLATIDETPPCPTCGAATMHTIIPRRRVTVDPIIVFQAPDGSLRFPGDANGAMAAKYGQAGYTRLEIRGAADMRRFESTMNAHERSIMARKLEHRMEARERREHESRSALRMRMQSMSERGRDLARAVMRRNDDRPRERVADANFHSEVYSFDRSNRDVSRDGQGRRQRD